MKRIFSLAFLMILGAIALVSQTKDHDYIEGLIDSANYLLYRKSTDAFELAEQAYQESIDKNYLLGEVKAAQILGLLEKRKGQWKKASSYTKNALVLCERNPKLTELIVSVYNEMAAVKEWEGKLDSAFYYSDQALKIIGKKATPQKGYAYMTRGNLFRTAKDSISAEENFERAVNLFKKINDSTGVARSNYNWAVYYYDYDNYLQAEKLLNDALQIFNRLGEHYWIALTTNVLGTIRLDRDKYEQAKTYFNTSLNHAQQSRDTLLQFDTYLNLSLVDYYAGNLDGALIYAQKADVILGEMGGTYDQKYLAEIFAMIYEERKDFETTTKYLNEIITLGDKLYNKEVTKAIENANRVEDQLEVERIKRMQSITGFIAFFSFCFAVGAYFYIRQRKKANFLLFKQQIFQHQKEINDLIQDQQLKTFRAKLQGEKLERERIAELVHDRISSQVAAMRWRIESITDQEEEHPEKSPIQSTLKMLNKTHQDLLGVVRDLERNNINWITEIEAFCRFISETNKIQAIVYIHGLETPLNREISEEIYSIILQLSANVLEHAKATEMNISINHLKGEEINVIVEDNGTGFDPLKLNSMKKEGRGQGLKNIEKKVASLNGRFNIDSEPKVGTTINIVIPV